MAPEDHTDDDLNGSPLNEDGQLESVETYTYQLTIPRSHAERAVEQYSGVRRVTEALQQSSLDGIRIREREECPTQLLGELRVLFDHNGDECDGLPDRDR